MMAIFPATANADSTASPTSFHPDEDGTTVSRGDILSDRFDGTDNTAHLTAVTNTTPERVQWRVCPTSVTDNGPAGGGITAAELASCNIIMGEDTSARVPGTSGVFTTADEAYDIDFNIPASLDNQLRDILILACVGSGEITDPGAGTVNCQSRLEDNIFFDDAETGEPDATAGEMTTYCTRDTEVGGVADTGGPGTTGTHAGDPCERFGADSAAQVAETDSFFKAFPHGSAVPNNGFVIRATTSIDLTTAGQLRAARDWGVAAPTAPSATEDPEQPDQDVACTVLQLQADRTHWQCSFPNPGAGDNDLPQAVWIYNTGAGTAGGGGAADCSGGGAATNCTLDSHFAVSQSRRANSVIQSFIPGGSHGPHNPPSPAVTAGCDPGQTPEKTHSDDQLGEFARIRMCIRDQFTDPFIAPVTEEVTAPGHFAVAGCPTFHDHDGDGRAEHCHGTTDANGHFDVDADNFQSTPGTATYTSCHDPQNAAPAPPASPPANHGCADAATTLKDTLTMTWGTQPSEVFLAFTDPAPVDPANPCRTGITFKRNQVGDRETLVVCTYDSAGNPIATDSNGFRLIWTITAAQGGEETAVRFEGTPPQETPSGGTANASIVAEQQGDNFITVELIDSNGEHVDSFSIEKQVEGENVPQRVNAKVTAFKSRNKVRGAVSTPQNGHCRANRNVSLFKRQKGSDKLMGTDVTNDRGRYGIKKGRTKGRFYARVAQVTRTDPNNGNTLNCLSGQSNDVRYKRKRR
jgi:hypothetical protein